MSSKSTIESVDRVPQDEQSVRLLLKAGADIYEQLHLNKGMRYNNEELQRILEEAEKVQAKKMAEIAERTIRLEEMSKQCMMTQMIQFLQLQQRLQKAQQPARCDMMYAQPQMAGAATAEEEEAERKRLSVLEERINTLEKKLRALNRQIQESMREKDDLRLKLMDLESRLLFVRGEKLAQELMQNTPTEEVIVELEKLHRIATERAKYCRKLKDLDLQDRVLNKAMMKAEEVATSSMFNPETKKQVMIHPDFVRKKDLSSSSSSSEDDVGTTPAEMESIAKEVEANAETEEADEPQEQPPKQ